MNVTKMTVDGSEFFLAADQSVEEAKNRVVDAVHHGGGLVDLKLAGHASVSVLVSQSIPIVFETIQAPEVQDDDGDTNWDWDEFSFLAS
jgi:hypothetical protein